MANQPKQYSDEDLIRILRETAAKLGRTPTQTWMNENGDVTAKTCENRFGSWNQALKAAGLELNQRKDIDDEELLDMLREAEKKLGHAPTGDWFQEHGSLGSTVFRNRFGSWNGAIRRAGLNPTRRRGITRKEIKYELKAAAMMRGASPTIGWWKENGPFSFRPVVDRFGSWNSALENAGLSTTPAPSPPANPSPHENIPLGENWAGVREKIIQRDDNKCRVCGVCREAHKELYGTDLHVHHITPRFEYWDGETLDPQANDPHNLMTLCADHHREWESLPVRPQMAERA